MKILFRKLLINSINNFIYLFFSCDIQGGKYVIHLTDYALLMLMGTSFNMTG